ncbi:MAG: hypothetical protein AAFQ43_00180 [Bacteroidota bacterium]
MRVLALALLSCLAVTSALAQPPYGPPGSLGDRIQRGLEDNALYLGGGLVAVTGGIATVGAMNAAGLPEGAQIVGAYVVGAAGFALGAHGAAQLVGIDGTLQNAFGDAMSGVAIGAPAGVATALLLNAMIQDSGCDGLVCIDSGALAAGFAGIGVAIMVPVAWVVFDYRNDGSTFRLLPVGPGGLGLTASIGL